MNTVSENAKYAELIEEELKALLSEGYSMQDTFVCIENLASPGDKKRWLNL